MSDNQAPVERQNPKWVARIIQFRVANMVPEDEADSQDDIYNIMTVKIGDDWLSYASSMSLDDDDSRKGIRILSDEFTTPIAAIENVTRKILEYHQVADDIDDLRVSEPDSDLEEPK